MDFTALVDVAIGLTFVYLGASLFVTITNEFVGQVFGLRARQLRQDLRRLLDGDGQTDAQVMASLRANPALDAFFAAGGTSGTYVDLNLLAHQIIGALRAGATGVATASDLVRAINAMQDCRLKTQLQGLSQTVEDSVDRFLQSVSSWVDRSLTMMGEGYKKNMQAIGLGVGFMVAAGLNLDTLAITSHLYRDKEARTAVSMLAADFVDRTSPETWNRCLELDAQARADDAACAAVTGLLEGVQLRNETLGVLPMGWQDGLTMSALWDALRSTAPVGWLLTALATSLGATFWFDLLTRLVNLRHGMKKPVVVPAGGTSRGE